MSSIASSIDDMVSAFGIPQYLGSPSLATDVSVIRIKLEIDKPCAANSLLAFSLISMGILLFTLASVEGSYKM